MLDRKINRPRSKSNIKQVGQYDIGLTRSVCDSLKQTGTSQYTFTFSTVDEKVKLPTYVANVFRNVHYQFQRLNT